ncbi:MAG: AAA family ATPase, partial [Acidobacteriia bacterium]|nr:AAA family ATPase [Terriglobia bacterium]
MFLDFYKLREQPFGVTPDPRFLYFGESHREALASLTYGLQTGRGFMALIAPPGMGKTTLLHRLMEQFRDSARTAFLFQQQSDSRGFMRNLLSDLAIESRANDLGGLQRELNEVLLAEFRQGRRFILILDEAQNLDDPILETVRMLSNFETPNAKRIQIILSGQPQLADKLERWELTVHRLQLAGHKGPGLFTRGALHDIAVRSGGIARNINDMCFHALSLGCVKKQKTIDQSTVEEAAHDLNLALLGSATRSRPEGATSQRSQGPDPSALWQDTPINDRDFSHGVDTRLRSYTPAIVRGSSGGRVRWFISALLLIVLSWLIVPRLEERGFSVEESMYALFQRAGEVIRAASGSHPSPPLPSHVSPSGSSTVGASEQLPAVHGPVEVDESKGPLTEDPGSQNADPDNSAGLSGSADGDASGGVVRGNLSQASRETLPAPTENAPSDPETSGDRQAATRRGSLFLNSDVRGATVYLNGTTKPGWKTPCLLSLPPGGYNLAVLKAGYHVAREWVDLNSGEAKQLSVSLKQESAPAAGIVVKTEPMGLLVFIDDRSRGASEVYAELLPGRHTLKILPPSGGEPYLGTF